MNKLDLTDYRTIIDESTGLVVARVGDEAAYVRNERLYERVGQQGFALDRDQETTIIKWPQRGSGLDDLTYHEIVTGNVRNVGVHPTPDPIMSSLVESLTNEASIAEITLMAGASRIDEVRAAINMAGDSVTGAAKLLGDFTFGHYVYNRGNAIDLVGASSYAFDQWQENGLVAVPLLAEGEREQDATRFYLEETPVDFSRPLRLIDPWRYIPTGNAEWPVMLPKKSAERGITVYVYLHQDQISLIQTQYSSSVHRYMAIFASAVVFELEGGIEKMLNEPEDGLIFFSGVGQKDGDRIRDQVIVEDEEARESGRILQQGYHIVTATEPRARAVQLTWRDLKEVDYRQRVLNMAACFDVNAMDYFPIEGIGYTGQASTQSFKSGTRGVMIPLGIFGRMIMSIFPRVYASVTLPNSRADEMRLDNLGKLRDAVGDLPYSDDDKLWLAENLASVSVPGSDDEVEIGSVDDDLGGDEDVQ